MSNSVEVKITPILDEAAFNSLKKKIDNLAVSGKIQPGQGENNAKALKEVRDSHNKASQALEKDNITGFNRYVKEMMVAVKSFIMTLTTGDNDLVKHFNSLSKRIQESEKQLLNSVRNLEKLKRAREKAPEAAAFKHKADQGKGVFHIGRGAKYDNKGQPTNFVKSQAALEQSLAKSIKDVGDKWKSILQEFSDKQGIGKSVTADNPAAAVKEVSSQYVDMIKAEHDAFIQQQEESVEKLQQSVANDYATQNELTGKIDQSTPEAKALIDEVKKINQILNRTGREGVANAQTLGQEEGDALGFQLDADAQAQIDNTTKSLDKQHKSFGKTVAAATLYGIAIRGIKKLLSDAVRTLTELDKALTTQAMVSGKTRKETYGLLKSYQDLAKQCGATTTEVAEVATAYFRQGKSVADALALTETAVKAAKVAGIDTATSVDYLTTAVNGFQLAAEDAIKVSDKFAALAASAAVSYDELAIALSKVAAQANLAGLSMDFTMGLLAKGIETTRESAESIGTALKTVLARMREISDYGETLDGETDINNVETQLAYVGIELRQANGELRSTEQVLDELGAKWDTLGSNQQAAIAKALAGTRQQSRLIAMMQDYNRTIELVNISRRSLGATEAQAAEYMEGMEAATNQVTTAYQTLITQLTSSDFIVGIVKTVGETLEFVSTLLSQDGAIAVGLTIIGGYLLNWLATTIQQKQEQAQANFEQEKAQQLQTLYAERQAKYQELLTKQVGKKGSLESKVAAVIAAQNKLVAIQAKLNVANSKAKQGTLKSTASITKLQQSNARAQAELTQAEAELNAEIAAQKIQDEELLAINEKITETKNSQYELGTALGQTVSKWASSLSSIIPFYQAIVSLMSIVNSLGLISIKNKKKETAEIKKQTGEQVKNAGASIAKSVAEGIPPPVGAAIALAVLAAIGIAVVAGIAIKKRNEEKEKQRTKENIQSLTQDIYNLEKSAQAIDTVAEKFDNLNKKIFKSKEELEEMNSLLDSLKDQGFTEEEISIIKNLPADKAKAYIEAKADEKRSTANFSRQARIATAQKLVNLENTAENRAALKSFQLEGWNADVQTQIEKAAKNNKNFDSNTVSTFLANATLSDAKLQELSAKAQQDFDKEWREKSGFWKTEKSWKKTLLKTGAFKEEDLDDNTLDTIQKAVKNRDYATLSKTLSADQLDAIVEELGIVKPQSVYGNAAEDLINTIANNDSLTKDMSILMDTSGSNWTEFTESYKNLSKVLTAKGYDMKESFPQLEEVLNQFQNSLSTFSQNGWTMDQVSKLNTLFAENDLDKKQIEEYAKWVASGYQTELPKKLQEKMKDPAFVTQVGNILTTPFQDLSVKQNKIRSRRTDLQEVISQFQNGELTESELLAKVEELGLAGTDIMQHILNGNQAEVDKIVNKYNEKEIKDLEETYEDTLQNLEDQVDAEEEALEKLKDERKKTTDATKQAELDKEIADQESKLNQAKNNLTTAQAERNNLKNINEISLQAQIENENKKLELYKEFLEKEHELETKALEDRKTAYEEYFSQLGKMEEDKSYFEQRDNIIRNITSLGASTDANSLNMLATLEDQLMQLEEERQKQIRERAQEELIANIDKQIEQIEKDFESLINNTNEIIQAMEGESTEELAKAKVAASAISNESITGLESVDLLRNSSELYGLNTFDLISNMVKNGNIGENGATITGSEGQKVINLKIDNKDITISQASSASLFNSIYAALQSAGVGI